MVDIDALFSSGIVAEVTWDGTRHVITKKGYLTKLTVNDQATTAKPLRAGDRVRIGSTTFLYEVSSD